jgi:ribosomal protein S18 acetylase RimI-like enzyme
VNLGAERAAELAVLTRSRPIIQALYLGFNVASCLVNQRDACGAKMIRAATADDLPMVRACAVNAYGKYVERIGKKPAPMIADFGAIQARGELFVAESDGVVIGFVVFYPKDGAMHLENVAVTLSALGTGVGSRLIAFAETSAQERGFNKIELYTNEKMFENFSYYEAKGYDEIGRHEEDGFNRVFYRKALE